MARLSFLVGAGVSYPARLPTVSDITSRVLSGHGIVFHSDSRFRISADPSQADALQTAEYVPRITALLSILKAEAERYYRRTPEPNREASYEDIFDLLLQIYDAVYGEYEDPMVLAFLDRIDPQTEELLRPGTPALCTSWSLSDLAFHAKDYVQDVVLGLCRLPTLPRVDHLGMLVDAWKDRDFEQIAVFTLNHDTLLESALTGAGLEVQDGFDGRRGIWDPAVVGNAAGVRLLKLHGSVNWQGPDDQRPHLLVGTTKKILEYPGYAFGDLHCQFRIMLRVTNRLLVCGYSFRDKGVNSYLIQWMDQSEDHRLVVVHREPDRLVANARHAWTRNWQRWANSGRASAIESWVEDAEWSTIKRAF